MTPRRFCTLFATLLCLAALAGCGGAQETLRDGGGVEIPSAEALGLVDAQATRETRALYANLQQITGEHTLFGHHDALAYGKNWDDSVSTRRLGRSDVKGVTGSHPALVGFDVLSYKEGVDSINAEARAAMRERILYAYGYGGVAALTWHAFNPVSGGDSWDTTRAVGAVLPGGERHARYRAMLDDVAAFLNSLRTEDGTLVPVVFRPFHEMNGDWFWWGKGHAPPAQFVRLWQFTVRYLRDEKGVRNALWAYCPDIFDTRGGYLTRYPGDAYVDMLGFDDYYDFYGEERTPEMFTRQLRVLGQLARERGKLAAVTETGLEGIPDSTWWTDTMLEALKTDSLTRRIVYVMAWRNAHDRPDHFYAPYPDHASAPAFRRFAADPFVWLAEDLPPLYRTGSRSLKTRRQSSKTFWKRPQRPDPLRTDTRRPRVLRSQPPNHDMRRFSKIVFAKPAPAFGVLLAAALLLACAPGAQAQRDADGAKDDLFGVVFRDADGDGDLDDGEKRLSGVRVSNMSGFTRTDEAGAFAISVEAPGLVFAVKPPGYQFPLQENGVPAFYYLHYPEGTPASAGLTYAGVAPTGAAPDTLLFPMHATSTSAETVANVVGDPQIPRPMENTFFRNDVMPDLLATEADFSLFLGDVADNDLRIYPHFERSVKLLDQPLYMAFGNHDVNFRADGNARRAETYRAHFGPDYYSFNYGASHFVVLNDVDYEGWNEEQDKRGSYYGRIGEEQMDWFRRDIAGVEPGRPVYLVTHIPLHPRFFDEENLATLLNVVEDREQVAALSGHLHGFMSWPYDENPSWEGADEDARGYSLGATSGAWWTGPFASDSIPEATATDGMPNGFFQFTFDEAGYTYDFIPAGEPRDFQLRVSAPHNYVVQDAPGRDSLVVNVFAGDERATVTARFDDRAAADTLRQFTGRDPFVVRTHDRRINRDDWSPGIATTSHLWRSALPEDLALGTHTVTVRATLPNGKTYRARQVFEVVESAPDAWATP